MHRRLVLLTAGLVISAAGNVELRAQTGAQPQPNAVAAPRGLGNGDLEILDVPFVPQSQALCGGAALAMVLRFWGEPGVRAEDFSALVLADGSGIQAAALERAVRELGWRALPFAGGFTEAQLQLQRGRPIVALLSERFGSNHYVVLVGSYRDRVLLHDPARGPFRVVEITQLQRAWNDAGGWGILVLPPEGGRIDLLARGTPDEPCLDSKANGPLDTLDGCSWLVDRGVRKARDGELEAAEQLFCAAQALFPDSPAPPRELAGIRFRQKRWGEAEVLAERAIHLEPRDAYTWELLATTRFLHGDAPEALIAWNQVNKPHVDLIHIDGLERTRYDVIARLLDLPSGTLLTDASLRRSRRRLGSLPNQSSARVDYLPLPDGSAQVNVTLLERPRLSAGARALPVAAVRTLGERTLRLELAGPTGSGELWSASWRWWQDRPALAARLDVPAAWGVADVWHVEMLWEHQTYRLSNSSAPQFVEMERRRSAVGCSQWATADLRWDVAGALERWTGRGQDVALELGLERRMAGDLLMLRGEASRAWSLSGLAPYATSNVLVSWRSSAGHVRQPLRLLCRAGIASASQFAPPLLWPGAGNGTGDAILLRAHPLLTGGVISGKGFGRALAHGGIELEWWPSHANLVALGVATFVDMAKPWSPTAGWDELLQADYGVGLRLRLAAQPELLRLDLARGALDGHMALSIGLETDRWFHD